MKTTFHNRVIEDYNKKYINMFYYDHYNIKDICLKKQTKEDFNADFRGGGANRSKDGRGPASTAHMVKGR